MDKITKDIILWIRNQDMVSMSGKKVGNIKAISKTIIEMDMGNCTTRTRILFTRVIGKTGNKFKEDLQQLNPSGS